MRFFFGLLIWGKTLLMNLAGFLPSSPHMATMQNASKRSHFSASLIQKLKINFTNPIICRIFANRNNGKNMDGKTLEFVTYCIAKLSSALHLPQQEIYRRLNASGILYGYIVPSYDVLHTFSSRYLMEDLTGYMKEKGVLGNISV